MSPNPRIHKGWFDVEKGLSALLPNNSLDSEPRSTGTRMEFWIRVIYMQYIQLCSSFGSLILLSIQEKKVEITLYFNEFYALGAQFT